MDIGPFISELLKHQNEVTVPGIGTFYKRRKSAYYDEDQQLFFPPSLEVDFSPEDWNNSGELASYISQQKNLSPPSARYFLEKYAEALRKDLLTAGETIIDTLGILKKQELSYSFFPENRLEDAKLFGLVPLQEIKKDKVANVVAEPIREEAVKDDLLPLPAAVSEEDEVEDKWRSKYQSVVIDNTPSSESVPAIQETDEQEVVEADTKKRKVWPLVLLIGLVLILGSAAAIYYYYPELFHLTKTEVPVKPAKKTAPTPAPPSITDSSVAVADSIYNELKTAGEAAGLEVEKAPDTINIRSSSSPATDTIRKAKVISYDIISASFNKRSEAENYVREMRKKGIDAQVVEDIRRPKFKVSIGHFTNKEKAEAEKRRIHEELTKEAWILKTNK